MILLMKLNIYLNYKLTDSFLAHFFNEILFLVSPFVPGLLTGVRVVKRKAMEIVVSEKPQNF